jgi:hypothetical protein
MSGRFLAAFVMLVAFVANSTVLVNPAEPRRYFPLFSYANGDGQENRRSICINTTRSHFA